MEPNADSVVIKLGECVWRPSICCFWVFPRYFILNKTFIIEDFIPILM